MRKTGLQIAIIFVGIILIIKLCGDILRLRRAADQIEIAEKRVEQLEDEKRELLKKKEYYQSEEFIEQEARNKLNMARPGETIVVLPQTGGKSSEFGEKKTEELQNWQKWWKLFF